MDLRFVQEQEEEYWPDAEDDSRVLGCSEQLGDCPNFPPNSSLGTGKSKGKGKAKGDGE